MTTGSRGGRVGLLACPRREPRLRQTGSALLAVLWLSAALAAVAFSLSSTVRGETDRTSTALDGLRCYYLAAGGVERAALELLWDTGNPGNRRIPAGAAAVDYAFPSGNVRVEIIPETARLDVNNAPVQELFRLVTALGVEPDRAQDLALAIDDWRRPVLEVGPYDAYYQSLIPSFRARHASLQEIEELLLVKGVTPELFYGTYVPAVNPLDGKRRLVARPGLADCLSVYGSRDSVDANTASPAVLAAVGLTPYAINALMERRRYGALTAAQLGDFVKATGAPAGRLRVGGNSMMLLRATARLRLANGQQGDLKRTVAAQVKVMPYGYEPPVHVLRWYDTAWSN